MIGITVEAGHSLADTAAQNGVVGLPEFRKLEKVLWNQFGLKCVLLPSNKTSAVGIGGKAKTLGRVATPVGIAGTNGVMEWTVVDDNKIPPLTPVNLLHTLGTVVNLPDSVIEFRK